MPKDTIPEVTDPMALIGLHVQGYQAEHQKNPGRRWFTYVEPLDEQEKITIGGIDQLHHAVTDIAQNLRDISDRLEKAAQALKGLNNL